MKNNGMGRRVFSMFTGVGGFELGLGERFEPIGFSEFDKYASELLKDKWPNVKNWGDATKIEADLLPDFDMLCGGFPCQAFSVAGRRKGFEDTRGTLFFDVARIIEAKKPRIVFLENVKGLLNHDEGSTFRTIIRTLGELGYYVEWMVLNSKFHGVPQNRERVFIIGSLGGERRQQILPFRETTQSTDEEHKIERIDDQSESTRDKESDRVYNPEGVGPTLTKGGAKEMKFQVSNSSPREIGFKKLNTPTLQARDYKGPKIVMTQVHNMQPRSPDRPSLQKNPKAGGSGHLQRDDTAWCIDTANTTAVEFNNKQVRRLTPLECERLQGFPDGWTKEFSDTQRYKMMGNAVTVNVIRAIGEQLQ